MTKLWYRETGDVTLPPLVMLHGLFASMQNWQSIVKRLMGDFHIYNVDMPNHGNSPHTPKIDYEEMRGMIIDLIENTIGTPVNLMGHSMGGKVGMLVALTRSELLKKLLVEDIAPKHYPPWFAPVMRAMANLPIHALSNRMEADQALAKDIPDSALRTFLLTNLVRDESKGFVWRVNLDALLLGGPSIAGFPMDEGCCDLPTLFVRGDQSPYVENEDIPLIKKFFSNAHVETVKGSDHWVHAREPELFTQLARDFFLS